MDCFLSFSIHKVFETGKTKIPFHLVLLFIWNSYQSISENVLVKTYFDEFLFFFAYKKLSSVYPDQKLAHFENTNSS